MPKYIYFKSTCVKLGYKLYSYNVRMIREKRLLLTKNAIFSLTLQPLIIVKTRQIASTFFKIFPGVTPPTPDSCCDPQLGSF